MGNVTMGYESPFAIHPGETIKEGLEESGMSQSELSIRTGISEKTISLILNGKEPVSADTALKIERVLNIDQKLLVSMQARYGADVTRLEENERLCEETPLLSYYKCYSELARFGYVEKTNNKIKKVDNLLRFFNVHSLNFVPNVMQVSFKRRISEDVDKYALTSWLRIGEIEAKKRKVSVFDKNRLTELLPQMRTLTQEHNNFSQKLVDLCAQVGVILLYIPHLKNTKVNGATYWVNDNPVVQMSLFNVYSDIFWFSFFHEIGHVLKHGKKDSFIDMCEAKNQDVNEAEKEANDFAEKLLIPDEKTFGVLVRTITRFNIQEKIIHYARQIGIDPGIVAGRIAKDKNIWRHVAKLRTRLIFNNR